MGKVNPLQAMRFPGCRGSQISRQSGLEGRKVVSPTHRPPLPPGNIPGARFCWRLSRLQGHSTARNNFNYTIGNEPATFRLVAQCLYQLRLRLITNIFLWLACYCVFAALRRVLLWWLNPTATIFTRLNPLRLLIMGRRDCYLCGSCAKHWSTWGLNSVQRWKGEANSVWAEMVYCSHVTKAAYLR
jgi:hypothetical protein